MKTMVVLILTMVFSMFAQAEQYKTYNGANLGSFAYVNCGANLNCAKDAQGAIKLSSNASLVATSGTLTVTKDQCGSTFYLSAATSATLPAASTVLGCEYDFVVASAASTDINPADNDIMLIASTYASGDATQVGGLAGRHVKLKSIASGIWELVASLGTLLDIN